MHILVTNDDGITAPGLAALAGAIRESGLGTVTVLAPDRNWSASGHVKTLSKPLRVGKAKLIDGTEGLASDGAPSDCVALALLGVIKEKIDLVVSGINPFPNVGHDVTYSGTVTAAMEAVIGHVPGIAVSLNTWQVTEDYGPAARLAVKVARAVIAHGVPPNTVLNLNVPGLPEDQIKGIRVTRQGLSVYRDALVERTDPRGVPYYWIGGEAPIGQNEPGTDFEALGEGWASLTPLQLDLTAHSWMKELAGWGL